MINLSSVCGKTLIKKVLHAHPGQPQITVRINIIMTRWVEVSSS